MNMISQQRTRSSAARSPHLLARILLTAFLIIAAAIVAAGNARAASGDDAIRRSLAKPLSEAQDRLKEKKYAEALAALSEADKVTDKSPYEEFVTEQLRATAALNLGDLQTAERSYDVMLHSTRLSPHDRTAIDGNMTIAFFKAKDYAHAATWGKRYRTDAGDDPRIGDVAINAMYLAEDYAGATSALKDETQAAEKAGQPVTEDRYKLLASSQLKAKDELGYQATLEKLVAHYPSSDYWSDLISRVRRRPGFADRLSIDVLRLQRAVGVLTAREDYVEYVSEALEAGFPAEAKQVVDQGFGQRVLGSGADAARDAKIQSQANRQAKEDAQAGDAVPKGAKGGQALFNTGLERVFLGKFATGIPLMKQGIADGAIKYPEDARLRLGMAEASAGQKGDARQTLASVAGTDGTSDLARLWLIHLQSDSGGH